jgi:2-polyprenyl-6-hydroxyphenyl methylase/3-demethylubiquinone-9 3-methyltransferase
MSNFTLTDDESLEGVISWFAQFGTTHVDYLRAHYARYLQTRDFTLSPAASDARFEILDVGAHWLHNAFFYANRGHHLIVMDAPDTLERSPVKQAAKMMGADIRPTRRMEKADGLVGLPDNSVDIILFCEVIEHLAFNPIPFWKQAYRVLRPGGHIIITTPNAFYHRSLSQRIQRLFQGECIGLPVSEILSVGTYGHHWKEFTLAELRSYFSYLSPDFDSSRSRMIYHPGDEELPITDDLEKVISQKIDVRAYNIFLDVALPTKAQGIQVAPRWEPS